ITTTFASNISRIKQIVDIGHAWGQRTAIIARSMENYTKTARELGYLEYPEGAIVHPAEIGKYPDNELCIITTGSQGEPTSALSRMALGDHRHVAVKEGDTVVMSSNPSPGNEELVSRTVDNLSKLGVGDVSQSVMRDRVSIGNEGVLLVVVTIDQQTGAVVAGPDITTRGFVPERDAAALLDEAKQKVLDGLAQAQTGPHFVEVSAMKDAIHESLSSFLYDR